jgi:hypothetical protein
MGGTFIKNPLTSMLVFDTMVSLLKQNQKHERPNSNSHY